MPALVFLQQKNLFSFGFLISLVHPLSWKTHAFQHLFFWCQWVQQFSQSVVFIDHFSNNGQKEFF